jgi:hypothetical protein
VKHPTLLQITARPGAPRGARAKPHPRRVVVALSLATAAGTVAAATRAELLDDFRDAARWQASASDQVKASLERGPRGPHGPHGSLCLRYDFAGVSGYAVARRALPLELPAHYAFTLRLSGTGPANAFQVKFVDASGDNVWWRNIPAYTPSSQPADLRIRQRQIEFAWGPAADKQLKRAAAIELVVASGEGGRGRLCFERLTLHRLDPPGPAIEPRITHTPGATALDLGRPTEFNGVTWRWSAAGPHAAHTAHTARTARTAHTARIEASDDGRRWRLLHTVRASRRATMALWLPEQEARYLRIASRSRVDALRAPSPADWPDRNALLRTLAADAPASAYPRAFHGQQNYWTLVGVDGSAARSALISEDGAIEPSRAGPSLEPVLIDAEGHLIGWADVQRTNGLVDDHLPLPVVQWRHPRVALRIEAAANGPREAPQMLLRYTVHNVHWERQQFTLALALRPWQVNPPQQFLNTPGGFAPVRRLAWLRGTLSVNGRPWLRTVQPPADVRAARGDEADALIDATPPLRTLTDDTGLASARLAWPMTLEPGERRTVHLLLPLGDGTSAVSRPATSAATSPAISRAKPPVTSPAVPQASGSTPPGAERSAFPQAEPGTPADIDARFDAAAAHWRQRLNRVRFTLPPDAKPLHDSLRSALAHMLLSRDGAALQPGTRSYARSWVRDGAMMVAGLLRLGEVDAARDFVRWYAGFLFANGKVPCCVDRRGADPVAENDSHGQFIHAVAELWRHSRDQQDHALVAELWPKVDAAARYMETLRQSERKAGPPGFFGMMPASISHEGYSAKPMHSYWDNFWALAGWRDAVLLAEATGHAARAAELKVQHDEFRRDLGASLAATMAHHRIPHLPGAAELGDFDPSSSTLVFSPAGAEDLVPRAVLDATWDRYWAEVATRRQRSDWPDYTPYELRSVSALLRLGHADRACAMLDFFHADQRPAGWNQWAEVVGRVEREPRFIGDMPHAWISSDYIRSALDLLAYERDHDGALVLAAGIPAEWLAAGPIGIEGLGTAHGRLSYQLKRTADGSLHLAVEPGLRPPPGGLWLAWAGRLHRVPDGALRFTLPPP